MFHLHKGFVGMRISSASASLCVVAPLLLRFLDCDEDNYEDGMGWGGWWRNKRIYFLVLCFENSNFDELIAEAFGRSMSS